MRLLNRLNQFQRLWQPSEGAPQAVTISELAARCFCSERHMRTLLRQLEQHGWLRWRAQSGRGKRGELIFLVSPHTVRASMMETVLSQGQTHNALARAVGTRQAGRADLSGIAAHRARQHDGNGVKPRADA
ncbi:SgrR family transcriptional regulator [Cronobacter sakazakii]